MRALVHCVTTPDAGAGRLLRGVAVAEALAARGHEPLLCASIDEDWAREVVRESGLELVPAPASSDQLRGLALDRRAELVHVDTPAAESVVAALEGAGLLLSRFEDGGTADGLADLVVAPVFSPITNPGSLDHRPGGQIVAVGPEYAPVRTAVVDARQRRPWRAGGMGDRLRVLVRLGREDSAAAMLPVVQALANSDLSTDVLVVAPSIAIGMKAEGMSTRSVRVLATTRRGDLPRLIADHDLVVTQPGPIMWELCCIGTPAALVPLSDDEEAAAADWVAAGVAVNLGRPGGDSRIANQLRALLREGMRRAQMGSTGLKLVDGEGAARVATLMETVAARPPR
jgi:hypothetical protein